MTNRRCLRDFGPQDLLDRHLARTGAGRAAQREPVAALQLNLLRMFLDLVYAACDDEHLDPTITRRILDKVIYGAVPQQPVVELVLAERARLVEYMATDTRPVTLPSGTLRGMWKDRP